MCGEPLRAARTRGSARGAGALAEEPARRGRAGREIALLELAVELAQVLEYRTSGALEAGFAPTRRLGP
jgi:hypothetical protein